MLRRHVREQGQTSYERTFNQYAVFSYIWGFGGDLPLESRPRFEAIARGFIDVYLPDFPDHHSAFDFIP
eukprot:3277828-Prymnesium_polylepis.1